ncbi:hypothetical protein [Streptomyces sp. CA-132043]|uniref:hypothetical protein n=1 Tax=Streptomyces sp. CA-132043 TaxID=3240048 RepID=UPI003D8B74A4
MDRAQLLEKTVVYAHTVRIGDLLTVLGVQREVQDMRALPSQRKRLFFTDGGALTLRPDRPLTARRTVQATRQEPVEGFNT